MEGHSIPAIVLGSGVTALGVLRSLGREKIPVFHIPISTNDFALFSRWSHRIADDTLPYTNLEELEAFLLNLNIHQGVLFPCFDSMVMDLARLKPNISSKYYTVTPSLNTLEYLIDKGNFAKILIENSLPHPETILIKEREDFNKVPDEFFVNAFLKPHDSQKFFSQFDVKAFDVQSRKDAKSKFLEAQSKNIPVLIQEYIPGSPSDHYFIDGFANKEGKIIAKFARRRLRMFPPDFGNSSYMASVPIEEVRGALNTLEKLFPLISFKGIFSAEFKKDTRDEVFKILEINTRPWWYVDFASRSGINVCKLAYLSSIGEPVQKKSDYKVSSTYSYPYFDFFAILNGDRNLFWKIFAIVKSALFTNKPIFSWADPIPSYHMFVNRLKSFFLNRFLN